MYVCLLLLLLLLDRTMLLVCNSFSHFYVKMEKASHAPEICQI